MAPQPIIIAVIGRQGSGKTNFINKLTGTREEVALQQHPQAIREFIINVSKDRQYVFVDTPRFEGSRLLNERALDKIAEWLQKKYGRRVNLSGIIYTYAITRETRETTRFWTLSHDPVCWNSDELARLWGKSSANGVRLVTTMWDKVNNKEVAESRVAELEQKFWKPLIEAGARHKRFEDNSSRSAWAIIEDLTGRGEVSLLQDKLVDAGWKFNETRAGEALGKQFWELRWKQRDTIKQLGEEAKRQTHPELVKCLQEEQRRMETELTTTEDARKKLETPFFKSIVLFSDKTGFDSGITVAENDYVIFLVGPTGEGKTWFTRQLYVNYDQGTHPHTASVKAWRCTPYYGSPHIVVVETPSFHSDRNNLDAGNGMTDWLESKFTEKCHSAILFLHSLDSDPTSGDTSMSRHLETFAKAFHNKFTVPSDVYVVPTNNPDSTLPSETLKQRLSQLKTMTERLKGNGGCNWRASVFPGVFKGQPETAWSAALLLLKGITQLQTTKSLASKPTPSQSPDSGLPVAARILLNRFTKKKKNRDLDAIITLGHIALELTPPEHEKRYSPLINLSGLLSERFNEEGRKEDLDESITLKRTASEYKSTDEPKREAVLLELDNHLFKRFKLTDSMVDLEEIISLRRAALERTPPDRCRALLSLSNALHEKFQKQGTESIIAEAVSLARAASGLHPPGHPDHALSRDHLASYLRTKVGKEATRAHVGKMGADPSSTGSYDIKRSIKKAVSITVEKIPLRLLHALTGVLCDRDAQISHFESSPQYKRLLSLGSSLDKQQLEMEINNVISEYFEFVTLSHRWGIHEPLLRDVEGKSVYDLGNTDGEAKLQMLCVLALQRNFQWAWSDTCCIDKDSSAELQEAIGSMFSWYHQSAQTIVHLSDVFDADSLVSSVWFTRGWTLQELLASHTVLFYTYDWSLYSTSDAVDHKSDPALLEKLQIATGIAKHHLTGFHPGMDDARSRLHWASRRRTTRPEDIAYSLFGIFQVHLPIFYGESAQNALGRLLVEIISRSGDVSVLDWVGKPSSFNSCFPIDLVPYQTVPHPQPIPSDPSRRNDLDLDRAQKLYSELARLPRAGFVNSKLTLPSTVHPLTTVKPQDSSTSPPLYTYEIQASRLRPLNVTLSVELDESVDTYILVRPWHPKTLEQQTDRDIDAVWKLLEKLEQPFNALLLKRSLRNEYQRIACDCTITARVQDITCILDSEVLIPEIV